eukprot:3247235-Rhodomonas_salina.1
MEGGRTWLLCWVLALEPKARCRTLTSPTRYVFGYRTCAPTHTPSHSSPPLLSRALLSPSVLRAARAGGRDGGGRRAGGGG